MIRKSIKIGGTSNRLLLVEPSLDAPRRGHNLMPATPAAQDGLGPWLARNTGTLADLDPELLAQLDL